MLNPARGGAYAGVWGRNPSAVEILLTESVNSTLICGFFWSYIQAIMDISFSQENYFMVFCEVPDINSKIFIIHDYKS
jgi:hypothetical protein